MPDQARAITADELLSKPDDGFQYELVRGELRRMSAAGFRHGVISGRLCGVLQSFVRDRDLGLVLVADAGFVLERDPDTVRAPDVGFISKGRLPAELPAGYFPGPPDLAAEVVSPSDRFAEVQEKVRDWLRAGCRAVWVIEPEGRTVAVYDDQNRGELLSEDDVLDGGEVLPGFAVPVRELFATQG